MNRADPRRRGVNLIEVLVAIAILAVLGGPLVWNMVLARRRVSSSGRDVRAVLRAAEAMELLQAIPYEQLPVPAPGAPREEHGVLRDSWAALFPAAVDGQGVADRIPEDSDPTQQRTYLWIETLQTTLEPGRDLEAKAVTVTVDYRAPVKDETIWRTYALRTVVVPR